MPGQSETDIDIRGFGNALVIVDGVPGSFSQIDPNEIENISILKDASAAVYGVQAANGVVLVTTKRGESGKIKINFNSSFSWQRPTIYPKMANAAEFVELTDEDKINKGLAPLYGPEILAKWRAGGPGYESTDWYKEITRDWSPMQQYNANISGGNERLKFFTALAYTNQEGMWKSGDLKFEKMNFRANLDIKLVGGLSAYVSLYGRRENKNAPNAFIDEIIGAVQKAYPIYQPYANGNKDYMSYINSSYYHPVALTDKNITGYSNQMRENFEGSIQLNYDADKYVKGLSASLRGHYSTYYIHSNAFYKKFHLYSYDNTTESYNIEHTGSDSSRLYEINDRYQDKVFQGSINYQNTFQQHSINALFLVETRQGKDNNLGAYREFAIDAIDELSAGTDANKDNNGMSWYSGKIGYVGRINYNYASRYLAEVSFRYDGSSKFPPGKRWGFFPSVSLGWRISEESFIKNNIKIIDNLKLRASWGKLGDDAGSGFQYLTGFTYPSGNYIFGDDVIPTLKSKSLANPNITWYTSNIYNIGAEAELWKGLLTVEFDLFYRKRSGLLTTRVLTLPSTFGATLPLENLNSDSNRGFELVLGHKNTLSNKLHYAIKGNVSYARAKYDHIERGESANQYTNWRNNNNNRWKNIYWGYKAIGQFQSDQEIAKSPVQDGQGNQSLRPGDIKYQDYNNDGVIDSSDIHVIGRGRKPEIMYGIDLYSEWKGVDLSVFLQGAANFNTYLSAQMTAPFYDGESSLKAFTNRWHREDLYDINSPWVPGKYPSTYASGSDNNKKTSSFWLQNASYLRVKEIQIGYTVPRDFIRKSGLEKLRVYLSGYNLFTFTKMNLLDPESSVSNGRYYPQQKMITFGLNLTL